MPLVERRWGFDAQLVVELDDVSNRLRLHLPDGVEVIGPAPELGALLPEAYRLLGEYLEQMHVPAADASNFRQSST